MAVNSRTIVARRTESQSGTLVDVLTVRYGFDLGDSRDVIVEVPEGTDPDPAIAEREVVVETEVLASEDDAVYDEFVLDEGGPDFDDMVARPKYQSNKTTLRKLLRRAVTDSEPFELALMRIKRSKRVFQTCATLGASYLGITDEQKQRVIDTRNAMVAAESAMQTLVDLMGEEI